jgi:hypothetical protein
VLLGFIYDASNPLGPFTVLTLKTKLEITVVEQDTERKKRIEFGAHWGGIESTFFSYRVTAPEVSPFQRSAPVTV